MMPMARRETVRSRTWPTVLKIGSRRARRAPSAKGMDIPTMKRKAGKTRSTKVMPLPARPSLKCLIQAGMSWPPAMSLTRIMVNMTSPRRASMEAMRLARGGDAVAGESAGAVGADIIRHDDRGAELGQSGSCRYYWRATLHEENHAELDRVRGGADGDDAAFSFRGCGERGIRAGADQQRAECKCRDVGDDVARGDAG